MLTLFLYLLLLFPPHPHRHQCPDGGRACAVYPVPVVPPAEVGK